ncbi:hypothetical protein [Methylomonas sp. AM2-LC]|uniref:hypothetical protein n=1 Tax=Methylomonas sp. AM2-LC TaxID=3153301 RepID=UPI0032676E77
MNLHKSINTVLTYTTESIANDHGFLQITLPSGERIEEVCRVFLVEVDETSIEDSNSTKKVPDLIMMYPSGGMKLIDKEIPSLAYIGLRSEQLASIVYNQNKEIFDEMFALANNDHYFYRKDIKQEFCNAVLTHAKTLSSEYWADKRTHINGICFEDSNNFKNISPEELIKIGNVSESSSDLDEFVISDGVKIGNVFGQPVYFVEKYGAYYYCGDPNGWGVLELWISGGVYPEGW